MSATSANGHFSDMPRQLDAVSSRAQKQTRASHADDETTIGLVVPQFLTFKLLKEISQGNVTCEPRSIIGAEAPRFEQHTHRVSE